MQKPEKFQFSNALTISIAHLLHDIYSSFLAPLLPLLITKLSISYSMASFLSVAQRLPSVLNPLVGFIADKMKVRYLLIIAPAVTSVCMSLIGLAPNYTVLLILLLVMGFSSTLFHVPTPVMMKKISGNKTGLGMSMYMVGGELARTLGPIAILGAVSLWGLEGTYKLIPFGMIVSVILYVRFKNVNISQDIKSSAKRTGIGKIFRRYRKIFLLIAGIVFFRALMKGAITIFLPTYLNFKGESLWFSGAALSIFQLAGAGGTLLAGPIADKLGRGKLLISVTIITPVLMVLFVYIQASWVLLPLLILIGLFLLASTPVLLSIVNDLKSDRPVFINSIYMFINFALSSLTILMVGFLSDWITLENTYMVSGFVAFGGIPFAYLLCKEEKKKYK